MLKPKALADQADDLKGCSLLMLSSLVTFGPLCLVLGSFLCCSLLFGLVLPLLALQIPSCCCCPISVVSCGLCGLLPCAFSWELSPSSSCGTPSSAAQRWNPPVSLALYSGDPVNGQLTSAGLFPHTVLHPVFFRSSLLVFPVRVYRRGV